MKPATDPDTDYKEVVRRGYDACARDYLAAREGGRTDLDGLLDRLAPPATVLDLGCGAGVPVARTLAERYDVTGVDFSAGQLELARAAVPSATFIESDIASVRFPPSSFDAVVAFYVLFHLPRDEQLDVLRSIWTWLKPSGYLLCTLSRWNEEPYTEDFLGVQMFWTNYAWDEYLAFVREIGFVLLETSVVGHGFGDDDSKPEAHPLVLVQRPAGA